MDRDDLQRIISTTYRNQGDALAGERVIAQARKISKITLAKGSSSHRIQEIILRSNVLCVLDRSFRAAGSGNDDSKEPFHLDD